jgi:hypothetical protein
MGIQNTGQNPLDDVMYWCFGYNWDSISPYNFSKPIPMPPPSWLHTQKTLTDIKSKIDLQHQFAITNFVDYLANGRSVPSALWDLSSTYPSPLHENHNPKLEVIPKSFYKTTYYLIQPVHPLPNDPSWKLVVQDPATALECC